MVGLVHTALSWRSSRRCMASRFVTQQQLGALWNGPDTVRYAQIVRQYATRRLFDDGQEGGRWSCPCRPRGWGASYPSRVG